jgi:hypothetical protein
MATAPTPGRGPSARAKEETQKQLAFRIFCEGEEFLLFVDDLGPRDDLISREQTEMPLTHILDSMDEISLDVLLIFYWMARRKSGDHDLHFDDVLERFSTQKAVQDAGFELDILNPEQDTQFNDNSPLSVRRELSDTFPGLMKTYHGILPWHFGGEPYLTWKEARAIIDDFRETMEQQKQQQKELERSRKKR